MPSKGKSRTPEKSSSTNAKPKDSKKSAKATSKGSSLLTKKKSKARTVAKKSSRSISTPSPNKAPKRVIKSSTGVGDSPLKIGALAPAFSIPDDTGRVINLSDYQGKKVVLYFYPKDDTPGCTTEACAFRDGIQDIRQHGAVVLGVSADSVARHRKFADKFQLNFPLLSDESKTMLQAYGVWKEKSLYGRKFMGIERTTVLINEDGTVGRIFPKVKVNGHFLEVLEALR